MVALRNNTDIQNLIGCVIHRDVHCDRQPQCGAGGGNQEVELLNFRRVPDALMTVTAVPLSHS